MAKTRANGADEGMGMNPAFVLGVAAYFIVHAILRLSASDVLSYDEAEQALLIESIEWGYNLQPPLYTWLQMLWVKLLGMNAAAFVIPKYLATFLVFVAIYALGQRVLKNDNAAMAATLGLVLFPEIGWEWLRERTHLILMSLACALTLLMVLRLRERRDTWSYVLLGLCIGCGVLSKYPYAIFMIAIFGAALSVRELRPVVLDKRMLYAGVVAALVLAPHAMWFVSELGVLKAALATRVSADAARSSGMAVTVVLAKTILSVLPPVFVIALVAGRQRLKNMRARLHRDEPLIVFFASYFALVLLLLVLATLLTSSTVYKSRWAQPFFLFVPMWLMLILRPSDYDFVARRVAVAGAVVALVLGASFHLLVISGPAIGHPTRFNDPFRELSAEFPKDLHNILAEDHYLGGNLKLWFEDTVVSTPQLGLRDAQLRPGSVLLVWNATDMREPPQALLALADSYGTKAASAEPVFIERPYARSQGRSMRIGTLQRYLLNERVR